MAIATQPEIAKAEIKMDGTLLRSVELMSNACQHKHKAKMASIHALISNDKLVIFTNWQHQSSHAFLRVK